MSRYTCPYEGWDHNHDAEGDERCEVCDLRAEVAELREGWQGMERVSSRAMHGEMEEALRARNELYEANEREIWQWAKGAMAAGIATLPWYKRLEAKYK